MSGLRDWLHCAHCGDRIGVYEPVWWKRADGSGVLSDSRSIRDAGGHEDDGSQVMHLACVAAATGDPG